jgi:hypothetical protein
MSADALGITDWSEAADALIRPVCRGPDGPIVK